MVFWWKKRTNMGSMGGTNGNFEANKCFNGHLWEGECWEISIYCAVSSEIILF